MPERTHSSDHGSVRVNVNVPAKDWEALKAVAAANYRSRSDHIRFLIAEAIRCHTKGLS